MPQNNTDLLYQIEDIAHRAGNAIMDIYARGFTVEEKEDKSPLTEADKAAHSVITEALNQLPENIPILSEEATEDFTGPDEQGRYWLVDPLDGTKEFIKRNGEFTVNIALIEAGVPVLSVVHAPALDLTYSAACGEGAWKQVGETPARRIHSRRMPDARPGRILVSRSHHNERQRQFLARMRNYVPMTIGSSLKFCLIAEGEADFYPRLGPTSEWDTAAGQCVLEQAGGQVTNTAFEPLRYNTRESLLNPDFLVIGDPAYNWRQYFS